MRLRMRLYSLPHTTDTAAAYLIVAGHVPVVETHVLRAVGIVDVGRGRPEINVRHILQEVVSALAENRMSS